MYKQLLSKQSSVNIEKQLNLRRIKKFTEKLETVENELKSKREQLISAEAEANKFLDRHIYVIQSELSSPNSLHQE